MYSKYNAGLMKDETQDRTAEQQNSRTIDSTLGGLNRRKRPEGQTGVSIAAGGHLLN